MAGLSPRSPAADAMHPYDNAWAIVRDLRAQVQDLRASLHAEQQQRAAEIAELRQEVFNLKDVLAREKHERQSQCHTLTNDLTVQASNWAKTFEEMKVQHRQQVGQLNTILQDEIRDRKASDAVRDTREQTMASEFKGLHDNLVSEHHGHISQTSATKDEHGLRINALMHDMELVVSYLQKVSSSWDHLRGASLMSSKRAIALGALTGIGGLTVGGYPSSPSPPSRPGSPRGRP